MATGGTERPCGICGTLIQLKHYHAHVAKCGLDENVDGKEKLIFKTCVLCYNQVEDSEFEQHMNECTDRKYNNTKDTYTRRQRSPDSSVRQYTPPPNHVRKRTKKCEICSAAVDENDYLEHLDTCFTKTSIRSVSPTAPRKLQNGTSSKVCGLCSKLVEEENYLDHTNKCFDQSSSRSPHTRKTKKCITCSESVDEHEYVRHVSECGDRASPRLNKTKSMKKCITCSEWVDESEYVKHVSECGDRALPRPNKTRSIKKCITCSESFNEDELIDHVQRCVDRTKNTEQCFICNKEVPKNDLEKHINACLSKTNPAPKPPQHTCFTCSSPVNLSKNSSHTIPCRSHHIYCIKCLQRSMNEFIQSKTAPVCNSNLCDYELSRHDVTCLPVDTNIINQLVPLVKTARRPQCPLCLFYVEFNKPGDLDNHAVSCDSENLIPCEYCHCPYNMNRLDNHSRQCRTSPASDQQKALIDYIVPRTKYPVTPQQIRVLIQDRKKRHLPIDPRSIVDQLAEYDGAFPFDVPTRDCDICTEAYIYDDIFVFGCDNSHKLCYGCFAGSCTSKMNNNEVLTCAVCNYQLSDGEIKQLRIPADEKRKFLDYQTQKTFNMYAGGKGVLRCPNKGCKWVAEPRNPNERFQVTCPLCKYEFCSLCSQQYHFRTTCQQLPDLTQRWFFWCNTERGNYWQARAQQDANFRAQLEDYERQRAANTQRNDELRQRYNELLADEAYKAQNCRLCPHCQRVVQHLGGCSSMICGQNYHGGDQQSGCGKAFNWAQAQPYARIGDAGPQQVRNDVPAPEQQKAVVHTGVRCDTCHKDIQGIRFDCIHCASLIFCETCEQRSTLEHANQIRNQNKQQHVFQLILTPLN